MRYIDKLADGTPWDIESVLDEMLQATGEDDGTRYTRTIVDFLLAEVPEVTRIAVRLITHSGGLSATVYTYGVDGERPHCGSMVQVPNRIRSARMGALTWGVVQPDGLIDYSYPVSELTKIVKWVHRYED